MKLRRFNIFTLIFFVLFTFSFGKNITGKLKIPFSKFTMNHAYFKSLILNLSCKDKFPNIKECAEQCYYREKNDGECVAFLKIKNTKECYICDPANISEIMDSNNTQINENNVDLVYILKYKKKKPVVYLSLDRETVRGTTVKGEGVNGTLINKRNTQIQAGKVNQGLHVKNRARLVLQNTANNCIQNLAYCTNGLSIALWINPSSLEDYDQYIMHSEHSIRIKINSFGTFSIKIRSLLSFFNLVTNSVARVGTWTHVAVVFDPDVGMFVYMDGRPDAFKSIDEAFQLTTTNGPLDYVFGSMKNGAYYFDGTLDEIKVFNDSLTQAGKFCYRLTSNVFLNIQVMQWILHLCGWSEQICKIHEHVTLSSIRVF